MNEENKNKVIETKNDEKFIDVVEEPTQEVKEDKKDNKKRNYILIGLAVLLCAGVGIGYAASNTNKTTLPIKKNLVFEYGDPVSMEPKEFLSEDVEKNVLNSVQLTSELMSNSKKYDFDKKNFTVTTKDKKYLDVGEYEVNISYSKESKDIPFEVKDTTAPTFKDFKNEIKVKKNEKNVDLKKFFKATDLSEMTITITGDVDFTEDGTYPIEVIAKDKYGNETSKKANVIVGTGKSDKKEDDKLKADNKEKDVEKDSKEDKKDNTSSSNKENDKDSSSKPSNKPSGNTGSTEKPKPNHTHKWVEQFKTIHHDAVYENKYVVDQPAYDEQVPKYANVPVMICNDCGAELNASNCWDHIENHAMNGGKGSWTDTYKQVVVGYDTVHHPEQGHNEQVLVKEAWDEKVSNGFKCSCGATK